MIQHAVKMRRILGADTSKNASDDLLRLAVRALQYRLRHSVGQTILERASFASGRRSTQPLASSRSISLPRSVSISRSVASSVWVQFSSRFSRVITRHCAASAPRVQPGGRKRCGSCAIRRRSGNRPGRSGLPVGGRRFRINGVHGRFLYSTNYTTYNKLAYFTNRVQGKPDRL